MIRSFKHKGLRRLFLKGDVSGVPPERVQKLRLLLADLHMAEQPADIKMQGIRLHPLRGDLAGCWSASITKNWRLIFRFEDNEIWDVDLVDYH